MAAKPLTPAQTVQINRVREGRVALQDGRATIEAEIRAELAQKLAALELNYALAIRKARELGVPKARIGVEGMGTKDPGTVNRWLARTEGLMIAQTSDDTIRWLAQGQSIRLHNFAMVDPWGEIDLPPLTGVVDIDPLGADDSKRRSGFIVTADQTPAGELTAMIQERSAKIEGSLPNLLNQWIEANS